MIHQLKEAKHAKISYETLTPKFVGKAIDCVGVSFATHVDPFTKALGFRYTFYTFYICKFAVFGGCKLIYFSQAQWGVMAQMFVQRAYVAYIHFAIETRMQVIDLHTDFVVAFKV
jgi:hypothetical protein